MTSCMEKLCVDGRSSVDTTEQSCKTVSTGVYSVGFVHQCACSQRGPWAWLQMGTAVACADVYQIVRCLVAGQGAGNVEMTRRCGAHTLTAALAAATAAVRGLMAWAVGLCGVITMTGEWICL